MSGESFRENYDILQRYAQTLREQDEPNIDDLLSIVTESVQAYKKCQARIDAVEKALAKALEGSTMETTNPQPTTDNRSVAPTSRLNRPPLPQQPGTDIDDDLDIPF